MQHNLLLITLIPFIKYSHVNMIQIQCAVKYIEMAHSLWTEHQFRRKNVKWTHLIVSLDLNNNNREWRGSSSGLGSRSFIRIQLVQSSEEEDVLEWRACKKQKKIKILSQANMQQLKQFWNEWAFHTTKIIQHT